MGSQVSIRISTNTDRVTKIVNDNTTPKQLLDEAQIDYSQATVHLDGVALSVKELNSSFASLGIVESAILTCVIKTVNR